MRFAFSTGAALAKNGIVDGHVVDPEKLDANPFIQQVMADVEQIAADGIDTPPPSPCPCPGKREGPVPAVPAPAWLVLPPANQRPPCPPRPADALTPDERFSIIETEKGYAVWDDIQGGIYVDGEGVQEEFSSEWQAEDYLKQVRKDAADHTPGP